MAIRIKIVNDEGQEVQAAELINLYNASSATLKTKSKECLDLTHMLQGLVKEREEAYKDTVLYFGILKQMGMLKEEAEPKRFRKGGDGKK